MLLNDAIVSEFLDELTLFIDSSGYNKMKIFLGISQWLLLGFLVQKVLETNLNFSCQKVRNKKKNKGTKYSTFKTKEKRLYDLVRRPDIDQHAIWLSIARWGNT